eukprot:scaffold13049_cov100-Skeletonema_dohrnii-CCMP3373.AAC.1
MSLTWSYVPFIVFSGWNWTPTEKSSGCNRFSIQNGRTNSPVMESETPLPVVGKQAKATFRCGWLVKAQALATMGIHGRNPKFRHKSAASSMGKDLGEHSLRLWIYHSTDEYFPITRARCSSCDMFAFARHHHSSLCLEQVQVGLAMTLTLAVAESERQLMPKIKSNETCR